MRTNREDCVFAVEENYSAVWRCLVNGRVFGDWRSRGEALAGLEVERRRAAARSEQAEG